MRVVPREVAVASSPTDHRRDGGHAKDYHDGRSTFNYEMEKLVRFYERVSSRIISRAMIRKVRLKQIINSKPANE